ncbi:hypothetical protein ACOSQ2_020656 [Xanthoceras sorbifolium]
MVKMSNSSSEQRDHQRDHGTAMGDRNEGGGTSPVQTMEHTKCLIKGQHETYTCKSIACKQANGIELGQTKIDLVYLPQKRCQA